MNDTETYSLLPIVLILLVSSKNFHNSDYNLLYTVYCMKNWKCWNKSAFIC